METRTVTQFHFLTWGELTNPPSAKVLLDFRRYVTYSFVLFLRNNKNSSFYEKYDNNLCKIMNK